MTQKHKAQETILEIDVKALKHNFDYLKSKLQKNTKFLAVVKACAYGNEAIQIAKYLQKWDVDYFAVAYVSEGIQLRKAGITKPILVLHPQKENFKSLIKYCLEPSLYSANVLEAFITVASLEKQKGYPVHIKFNTGLNRLGFEAKEIPYILAKLNKTETIKVQSIFSHLAASEDLNEKPFTCHQIAHFKDLTNKLTKNLDNKPLAHLCNTSGILNYPEAHLDMVRGGIGLYGYGNSEKENKNFKPIGTLKTVISQIHHIKKGASVGYNRSFISPCALRTATLPIGHADGIGRSYGNGNGFVYINGQKALIVGNVCMDMIMVNVTNIACVEGDEVIVFGQHNTAEALADSAKTISYELLTAVSQRIKRIYKE